MMQRLLLSMLATSFMAGSLAFLPHGLPTTGHASSQTSDCPETPTTKQQPPEGNRIFGFGGEWHRSEDGELWANAGTYFAGGIKVGWRKPVGSTLRINAQRRGGDEVPFDVSIPDGYDGAFQSTGLEFSTAGCWEVFAQAGDSQLNFVTRVAPIAYRTHNNLEDCETIERASRESDLIFIGTIQGNVQPEWPGFIWQTVLIEDVLKGDLEPMTSLEILRFIELEAPLEVKTRYLFFMPTTPGFHLRPICPTLKIDGDTLTADMDWGELSSATSLNALIAEVKAFK